MARKKRTADALGQQLLFSGTGQETATPSKHPLAGRKQSAEHVRKRVEASKGKCGRPGHEVSEETRRKIGAANKGKGAKKGHAVSEETRHKIGESKKGNKYMLGHKHTAETRRKMSEIAKARGESHNFRVDGEGDKRRKERKASMQQLEYRLWREAVFARDGWTCQECGKVGGELNADHVKPWRDHPELRYDVINGRTLCEGCHRQTPTFGGRMHRSKG